MAAYERLSGLDEMFLGFETRNAYIHVAVTAVFDRGPLGVPGGGVDVERIREHLASKLPHVRRFRQRLGYVPFARDAVWVDDEAFDLRCHVRHASLPRPGSTAQLQQRCAEILERPLNRKRPLWEAWVIEGLANDTFALLVKVHHCIVDGIAGIGMLASLLDTDAVGPSRAPDRWRARPAPTRSELLRDEVTRRVKAVAGVGRTIRSAVADPIGGLQQVGTAATGLWRLARTGLSPAPAVCINGPIGPHRQVSWLGLDLEQLKGIKRRLGGTVNDVLLTIVSGALGTVLRARGELPESGTLRAAVPVSIRTPEEFDAPGNRVSVWLCPLPVSERNPLRRLATIRATTEELKRGQGATGGSVLAEVANWAGGAMVEAAAKVINATRIYNLIVTNVPGPSFPLYLAGARMTEAYPHLPLFEQQGIGIALLSYMGRLYVGMASDWSLGELLADVRDRIEAGFFELAQIAGVDGAQKKIAAPESWDRSAVA